MIVISKKILHEFGMKHPDSIEALNDWWEKVKGADWSTPNELVKSFNTVDYVGNDRYAFNIKGNKYRLVAMIFFDIRTLYVRFVGTHAAYDEIDCTNI